MPPHPPERSRNWRSWRQASLTTRISIFAGMLTTIVLLPALLASYAALHTLMLEKLGYELEATASEVRLRFEARSSPTSTSSSASRARRSSATPSRTRPGARSTFGPP